jgi:hypothetical protein
MFPEPPPEIEWLPPWQRLDGTGDEFVTELWRELPSQHVLHGLLAVAVARRSDCDDVLFVTNDPMSPLAVVHLTWAGRKESDPRRPSTSLYKDWRDWVERCLLPDHEDYC